MSDTLYWQTEEFWLGLRKRTSFRFKQGGGFCDKWCRETLPLLSELPEELGFEEEKAYQGECRGLSGSNASHHTWLQRVQNGRTFIADGTVRPFVNDDEYDFGFYGWLEDAPERLQDIYVSDWLFDGLYGD